MTPELPAWIALLRGIGPGIRQIPMSELRAVCTALGWSHVQSYIQSGNVVFQAQGAPADLEADLERAIQARFGLEVPVVVRSARDWAGYVETNPLRAIADREPVRVLLALAKQPPLAGAEGALQAQAADGERSGGPATPSGSTFRTAPTARSSRPDCWTGWPALRSRRGTGALCCGFRPWRARWCIRRR